MTSNAISALRVAASLVTWIVEAIAAGKPERVEAIFPAELRTTIARRLADAKASERFAAREDVTVTMPVGQGEGHQ